MATAGPLERIPGGSLLLLGCLVLYVPGLGSMDLWPSHEARAAQDAHSVLNTGDLLLPHLFDGTPELQKPPGFYWIVAALGRLNGGEVDAWCVRVPSVFAATATVLVLYNFCLPTLGRGWSIATGFLLMSSVHWFALARTGRIDMPLTFVATATILIAAHNPGSRTRRILNRLVLILGLAAALYLKGLIGWLMIQGTWFMMNLLLRRPTDIPRPSLVEQAFLGIASWAIFLPWFLTVDARLEGELYRTLVVYHHFRRAFGGTETLAGHPIWFYATRLAVDLLPWSPLLAGAAWFGRKQLRGLFDDPLARFATVAFLVISLGLTASRFKRADYLLPAYPWFTLLLVLLLRSLKLSPPRRLLQTVMALYPLAALAYIFLWQPVLAEPYRVKEFAAAIRSETQDEVILFRVEAHLLAWRLKQPLQTLIEWDDLQAATPCLAVIPENELETCRKELGETSFAVLYRSRDYCAGPPHRPYLFIRIERVKASR